MELKYGRNTLDLEIEPRRIMGILQANEKQGLTDPLAEVEKSLINPVGSPALADLIKAKKPGKVVIVVNDVSRPTPYNIMLPPVLRILAEAGINNEKITFLIATGVHEPHTAEQNQEIFGQEIIDNYRFVFHNCDQNLVNLGKLASGNELYLNKEVVEADFIITTGVILPHYFAGFSGGRKSILPGVAGRETIEFNHSRMVELMGNLPPIEKNPVSLEMIAAARQVNVDFILNVVTNSQREIVQVVAGDLEKAWYQGVKTSASMYNVPIKQKADVTIVTAGGFPRDINIYQAQKALDHADHATKEGGTIILAAECQEGLGDRVFAEWMSSAKRPEDNIKRIKKGFVIGGHKAFAISKVALKKEIILISDLTAAETENLYAKKMNNLAEALNFVKSKYNQDYNAYIMPQGSLTVPVLEDVVL